MEKDTILVLCNWNRIDNIEGIFNSLKNQSVNNFDVLLWNNNTKNTEYIDNLNKNFNYLIIHSESNIGGIGRFYGVKKYIDKYQKFIFIDDDQQIDKNFVKKMLSYYEPKSIKSRWGWQMVNNNYYLRTRVTNNKPCNYCGTGGMIGDTSIFRINELFFIPDKYKFIEDLWLTYIAQKHGFKTYGIDETLVQLKDGKDQFNSLRSLKNEFLQELIFKYKWKI